MEDIKVKKISIFYKYLQRFIGGGSVSELAQSHAVGGGFFRADSFNNNNNYHGLYINYNNGFGEGKEN